MRRGDPPWVSARGPSTPGDPDDDDFPLSETDREGIAAVRRELEHEYEASLAKAAGDAVRPARRGEGGPRRRAAAVPGAEVSQAPRPLRAEPRQATSLPALAVAFILGCVVGGAIAALAITTFILGRAAVTHELGGAHAPSQAAPAVSAPPASPSKPAASPGGDAAAAHDRG